MKHKKPMGESGATHLIIPLLIICLIAIGGVYMIVSSHADSPGEEIVVRDSNFLIKELAGKDVDEIVGLKHGNRIYIMRLEDYYDHKPIGGADIKLSSYDRSAEAGCGSNGPFGHRYRDSTKRTNEHGEASYFNCTDGDFKVQIRNVPGDYTTDTGSNINLKNKDEVEIHKTHIGDEEDGVDDEVEIKVKLKHALPPFTRLQKDRFARAAAHFWNQHPPTKTQRESHIISVEEAVCKPSDVIFYYKKTGFRNPDDLARAALHGAKHPLSEHLCHITWNSGPAAYGSNVDSVHACITFVHEYGHLLGYQHAVSPNSIMYAVPNWQDQDLIDRTGCFAAALY